MRTVTLRCLYIYIYIYIMRNRQLGVFLLIFFLLTVLCVRSTLTKRRRDELRHHLDTYTTFELIRFRNELRRRRRRRIVSERERHENRFLFGRSRRVWLGRKLLMHNTNEIPTGILGDPNAKKAARTIMDTQTHPWDYVASLNVPPGVPGDRKTDPRIPIRGEGLFSGDVPLPPMGYDTQSPDCEHLLNLWLAHCGADPVVSDGTMDEKKNPWRKAVFSYEMPNPSYTAEKESDDNVKETISTLRTLDGKFPVPAMVGPDIMGPARPFSIGSKVTDAS